uniref:Uncharacterized protein n=1 Tax=Pygocentrus nattereri TaxID=42514 RepID=A0AAR2JQ11_PYGNA
MCLMSYVLYRCTSRFAVVSLSLGSRIEKTVVRNRFIETTPLIAITNKHITIDLGTGLVVSPKDYFTKYRY